jgi:receptor expression-enhancing protein 1/2/3/4
MPQTQGATILYSKKIQPFFHTHESEIDAALSSFRGRAYGWFQDLSRRMFGQVMGGLASQPADFTAASALATAAAMSTGAPPSMADPVSGPAALAGTLWRTFGPSVMASGAAAMRQTAAPGAPIGLNESARAPAPVPTTTTLLKPPVPPSHNISRLTEERRMPSESQSVIDRRRQLEAELAALGGPSGGFEGSPQITPASSVGPFSPSPFSPGPFSPGVWSRTSSSSTTDIPGGGDEAEVPSDIETENKASRRRN